MRIFNKKFHESSEPTHPFFALFIILIIATILANIIPSGSYDRIEHAGRTIINPDSFQYIEKIHVGITDFFLSFHKGFVSVAGLAALMFFVGAAFGIANYIGFLEGGLKSIYYRVKDKNFTVFVTVLMFIFTLFVSFTGLYDIVSIVFIPVLVPLMLVLGYDAMVGVAIVMVAACIGAGAAMANPFFTAIAHDIAELPIYSGMWFRGLVSLALLVPSIIYIIVYANKVKRDPNKSILKDTQINFNQLNLNESKLNKAQIRASVVFIAFFIFLIYGTLSLGFGIQELTATFAAMSIFTGLAYGMGLNKLFKEMGIGMNKMLIPVMVMIFARAVLYVLEEAKVIDTIIVYLSQFVIGSSPYITVSLSFILQTFFNFIIPSGSGQALVTMPIMVPLSDMGDLNRQIISLASQFGDGFSNFIWPTNGSLLAILAIAQVPYTKWIKFFLPLFLIIVACSFVILWIAILINLGPF